jgi:hypothetical protein
MKAELISLCINENLGDTFTEKHLMYFQNKLKINKSTKQFNDLQIDKKVIQHCIRNYKKILLYDDSINLKELREKKGRLGLHSQFIFTQVKEFLIEQNLKIDRLLGLINGLGCGVLGGV